MFDKVIIIDNSVTIPTAASLLNPDRPRAFIPIFSQRGFGRDSEIKLFRSNTQAELVSKYGKPNVNTTLLPLYYAYEFLRGGGDVYIRRITSVTASLAHAVIIAKTKLSDDGLSMTVKYEIQTIGDDFNSDIKVLEANAEALMSELVDADGFQTFPIMLISMSWAGAKGNEFTFRLLPNVEMDSEINEKSYLLSMMPPASTVPVSVGFSLDTDSVLDGESVFSNDYVYSNNKDIEAITLNTYNRFLEVVSPFIPADELTKPDIFFGKDKERVPYPNYTILPTSVDLTASAGIALQGGDDGDFTIGTANRTQNMMTRYIDSFDEIETNILENEYKYYIDFVFDFAATQEVKDTLIAFANRRKSTRAIIDTGLEDSATSILNFRKSGSLTYDDVKVDIVSGIGTYRDPFTNKRIIMPLSLFDAFAIPNHITTYLGGAYPWAGSKYKYENMEAGSYRPQFYNEESDMVKNFVNNRINFAFEDIGGYQAFHQSTTKKLDSSLGERNNVYLLHQMVRQGLLLAKIHRWNFNEDIDIERYQLELNQIIGTAMADKLGSLSIEAKREGNIGAARNRVAVTVNVRFKYINKGTTFTFIIS